MDLIDTIKQAVRDRRFIVSIHARRRIAERNVTLWQIESGLEEGAVIDVRVDSEPCPSIVVDELLSDGSEVRVVWSWLAAADRAKLVTVFFPEA